MTKKRPNQHVVPRDGRWVVKGAGNSQATKITRTQKQATDYAERIARILKSDTKVHGRNGQIRDGNSYGNDPFPPRDKKQSNFFKIIVKASDRLLNQLTAFFMKIFLKA